MGKIKMGLLIIVSLLFGGLTISQAWTLKALDEYRSGKIAPASFEFYKVMNGGISECPSSTQQASAGE